MKLNIEQAVGSIITLMVAILFISTLMPVAFDQFYAANVTAWDAAIVPLWEMIPLFAVLGLVIGVITWIVGRKIE